MIEQSDSTRRALATIAIFGQPPSDAHFIGRYGRGVLLPAHRSVIDTAHRALTGLSRWARRLFEPTDPHRALQNDSDFDKVLENT